MTACSSFQAIPVTECSRIVDFRRMLERFLENCWLLEDSGGTRCTGRIVSGLWIVGDSGHDSNEWLVDRAIDASMHRSTNAAIDSVSYSLYDVLMPP